MITAVHRSRHRRRRTHERRYGLIEEKVNKIIEKTIEYLDSVDLSKLSMADLSTFAATLNTVRGMTRLDYLDHLMQLTSSGFALGKAETNPELGYAIEGEKITT